MTNTPNANSKNNAVSNASAMLLLPHNVTIMTAISGSEPKKIEPLLMERLYSSAIVLTSIWLAVASYALQGVYISHA